MPLPEKNQNNVHVNEMKPIKCVKNKGVCYLSVQFQHDLLPLSQMRSVHVDVTPTSKFASFNKNTLDRPLWEGPLPCSGTPLTA